MKVDKKQKNFDNAVEDDIKNSIKTDVDADKNKDPETPGEHENVKDRKKEVDKTKKKTDNNIDTDDDDPDEETELYDSVVAKALKDHFDGDESKIGEARKLANVAIKTFDGDAVKAAKSYKQLWDQNHELKGVISKNKFIENLINDAKQGKTVDENYVKELLGTATPADQPTKTTKKVSDEDELDDDFDLDTLSADDLIKADILDKTKYEAATSVDRRDMIEKARIRYGYKVLPQKMAERTLQLSEKKKKEADKQAEIKTATNTNKNRLNKDLVRVSTKYDLDFDENPVHAQLWEEVNQVAWKIPDLADGSNRLVAENAVEQAVQHVFTKHGINLPDSAVKPEKPANKETHKVDRMTSGSDAMRRILSSTEGFKGVATQRKGGEKPKNKGNSLNDQVNNAVEQNLQRNFGNTHMISGIRKTDNKKS